jgi:hypothetical protein
MIKNNNLIVKKYQRGGSTDEGGWSSDSRDSRENTAARYDPAGGLGPISQGLYMLMGGNQSRGEEN